VAVVLVLARPRRAAVAGATVRIAKRYASYCAHAASVTAVRATANKRGALRLAGEMVGQF